MSDPQDDADELQSGEAESNHVQVNRNLFKDQHGFRIAFFLHKSIKKNFSRRNLTRDIERRGGIVLDTDIGCDTVLVDVMYDKKDTLQISYNTDDDPRLRKVFVERISFVQHCIRDNHFAHRIPALKGMGGTVGRARVPFTAHDDECLCYYLARVLPDKVAGGRLGLEVYKELVRTAAVKSTHTWGARHTPESWKERYKKNAAKFDEWIEDIVKQEGRSRKQLWPEDRRFGQKVLRGKHIYVPEEDSSEGNYEEEPPQPPRKRRRSDYSPPPPKRRRAVQRSSDQEDRTPPSSDRKGKARAFEEEEEEEEEEDQPEDYVDQDEIHEPGPSRSQRSLEATNLDILTHRTQPNTASFLTQETIVATAPSGMGERSKETSHLPDQAAESSSLVRRSMQLTRASSPSENEPLAVIDLTSPSGSMGRSSPIVHLSPTRTLVNPSQTQEARPPYKRPLKAARRPRAMIEAVIVDAPYRNTRSRSQSVEPSAPNPPVRGPKKKGNKERQGKKPALATVDEIQDDNDDTQDDESLQVADEPMPPLGEILADEFDVEKMLMSDDFNQDEELGDVRGVSLDTDDAQTEQNLRPTQPPRQAFSSLRKHPSDILKEFQESSAIWTNRYSGPRPHLSNRPAVPVRNTKEKPDSIPPPSLSRDLPDMYNVAVEPPRTPLRRPRKNSASSTDSFPVSGTRASALKKKLQQQEKRSPYKPPIGTRASKFAGSRR